MTDTQEFRRLERITRTVAQKGDRDSVSDCLREIEKGRLTVVQRARLVATLLGHPA